MAKEHVIKVIIFGTGEFAEVVFEYLNNDPRYEVVAFTEDSNYIPKRNNPTKFGKPRVPFEYVEEFYPPEEHIMFIAIGYSKVNTIREKKYKEAKKKGYKFLTYVSPYSFVWQNVKLGENVFIFENNVIQPFVEIGDNTILWSGNHIGHHSKIGENVFISSHVVVSGNTKIGNNTFLGVNSTIIDGIKVANYNIIGAMALVIENTEPYGVYVGIPAKKIKRVIIE